MEEVVAPILMHGVWPIIRALLISMPTPFLRAKEAQSLKPLAGEVVKQQKEKKSIRATVKAGGFLPGTL